MRTCDHKLIGDDAVIYCCTYLMGHAGKHWNHLVKVSWQTGMQGQMLIPPYPGNEKGQVIKWKDSV